MSHIIRHASSCVPCTIYSKDIVDICVCPASSPDRITTLQDTTAFKITSYPDVCVCVCVCGVCVCVCGVPMCLCRREGQGEWENAKSVSPVLRYLCYYLCLLIVRQHKRKAIVSIIQEHKAFTFNPKDGGTTYFRNVFATAIKQHVTT